MIKNKELRKISPIWAIVPSNRTPYPWAIEDTRRHWRRLFTIENKPNKKLERRWKRRACNNRETIRKECGLWETEIEKQLSIL